MAGLVPAIHVEAAATVYRRQTKRAGALSASHVGLPARADVDARDKPGHDG